MCRDAGACGAWRPSFTRAPRCGIDSHKRHHHRTDDFFELSRRESGRYSRAHLPLMLSKSVVPRLTIRPRGGLADHFGLGIELNPRLIDTPKVKAIAISYVLICIITDNVKCKEICHAKFCIVHGRLLNRALLPKLRTFEKKAMTPPKVDVGACQGTFLVNNKSVAIASRVSHRAHACTCTSLDTRCTQALPEVYSTEYPSRRCVGQKEKREGGRGTATEREVDGGRGGGEIKLMQEEDAAQTHTIKGACLLFLALLLMDKILDDLVLESLVLLPENLKINVKLLGVE
ncbi:hypothetical protein EAG_15533 [Camponotus floridanus]|uniref:Uncharacterized protein n=1 Tax=Camponotus floridanus TaxID=104421 RepID=E2AZL1_CAMFO|nr:hypothetical protein EAG_15533 [Camponotus floridanus]